MVWWDHSKPCRVAYRERYRRSAPRSLVATTGRPGALVAWPRNRHCRGGGRGWPRPKQRRRYWSRVMLYPESPISWIPEEPDALGAPSRYPQAVSIQIFEVALTPGETFFVDRDSKFFRDGVDIVHVEVNQRFRNSITLVLGQVKPDRSPGNRNKPREARLELMLPLFTKAEPLVPRDGASRIVHAENWDDFLVHVPEATRTTRRGR